MFAGKGFEFNAKPFFYLGVGRTCAQGIFQLRKQVGAFINFPVLGENMLGNRQIGISIKNMQITGRFPRNEIGV